VSNKKINGPVLLRWIADTHTDLELSVIHDSS